MKATIKIFLFIGLCAGSLSAFAQDIIVLKTGDEIKAIVQEIGIETVKYKKYTNPDGPAYTIPKSDIFMVKYESGAKDVFTEGSEKTESSETPKIVEKPRNVETKRNIEPPLNPENIRTQPSEASGPELSIVKGKMYKGSTLLATADDVRKTLSVNPEALQKYNSAKNIEIAAFVITIPSSCVLGYGLGSLIVGRDGAGKLVGYGAIGCAVGLGIAFYADSQIKSAVNIYNSSRRNGNTGAGLKFGLTKSGGIGLAYNF